MTKVRTGNILVVEDDRLTRDLLREELHELGYHTTFLESGKDAVSTVCDKTPDLILLDIMMPELDGYAVCEALRQDPRTMHIPIIFITAKDTHRDMIHGLTLGANDYILKPFNIEVLAARIETQMRTKRLMDQVQKQNTELEKLNTTTREFLGMASHDLRTPVSVIQLIATTLLDEAAGPLSEAQKSLLSKLHQQNSYMSKLLGDLLNVAHIESGKIAMNIRLENINALLKENLSTLALLAKKKSIDFALDIDPSLPQVPIDKARFTEIIDNIVSNAIKFTPEHGRISVRTSKATGSEGHPDGACISIADTGVGMDAIDLDRLFREFSPVGSKPTKGESSTGLGLFIAKKLTELHQGKLEVSSSKGVGTKFVIKLPLR